MKSLKKNLIYQSANQLIMVITPLISSPYLARTLGNEMYGVYSYYYSIAYYFSIFSMLGLANYGNRTIAKIEKDNKVELSKAFVQMMLMQTGMLAIVSIVYFSSVFFWGGEFKLVAIIEWLYVLYVGLDITWFYFGIEEFKTTTLMSLCVKTGMLLATLTFIKSPADIYKYSFIMSFGLLLRSLILWSQLPRHIQRVSVSVKDVIQHIKPNLVLFIPVVSLALFHYTDKIMLGAFSTWKELGYYTNSDRVVNIPMGLIEGLGVVMLPRISALSVSKDSSKIDKYINNSIIVSLWAGIALCFGIKAIDTDFIPFFFGKGYMRCAEILEWLAVVIIVKAVSNVLRTQYLIPMEKDKEFNVSVIAAAIVNIALNYVFIPRYGAMGAVLGTLTAESIVLVLYTTFSKQVIHFKKIILPGAIFIISGIVMEILVSIIKNKVLVQFGSLFARVVAEICAGAAIYCILTLPYVIVSFRKIKVK